MGNDDDDNNDNGAPDPRESSEASDLAWGNLRETKRRQGPSTQGHEAVMKSCRLLIWTLVISGVGDGETRCDPWVGNNERYKSNLVYQCWTQVRRSPLKFGIAPSFNVARTPTSEEARLVHLHPPSRHLKSDLLIRS
jgi:hypothetical protein